MCFKNKRFGRVNRIVICQSIGKQKIEQFIQFISDIPHKILSVFASSPASHGVQELAPDELMVFPVHCSHVAMLPNL